MRGFFIVCASVAVAVSLVLAEEKPKQPSPEEVAKLIEKLAEPGESHKRLELLAGDFKATVKEWMGPGEPQVSEGLSKNELIFGGRYLKCDYTGIWMGKPFKGMQLVGYDNQKKKYVMNWVDNVSTSILQSDGEVDASGKVITFTSSMVNPMTGKEAKQRMLLTLVDKDTHTFEMSCNAMSPDGSLMKMMEITYTRVK